MRNYIQYYSISFHFVLTILNLINVCRIHYFKYNITLCEFDKNIIIISRISYCDNCILYY